MTTPLVIVLRGEDDLGPILGKVKEELGGVGKAADDAKGHGTGLFSGMMQVAGGMLASNVIGGLASQVGGFLSGTLSAAKEANLGFAQTEAVIKSTGGAAGFTAQQVSDMAGALSAAAGKSMFGDDDILKGQNLLLTFTNIKTTLPETSKVMVDMATAMHTDVAGGAIQLGKALNDPIAGISALSRVGVTFDAQQKAQIKTMQDAGNMAGAQGVILKELNKEFGGSAAAAVAADGGMAQFKDRMGEMQETIGKAVLPVLGKLMGVLNDTLLPVFENAAAGVGPLIDQISSFGGAIGDLIHAVSLGDDGFVQWGTAVDTLTGIIGGPAAQAVAQFVGYAFDLVGAIQAQQGPLVDLQGIWQAYLSYLTTVASAIQGVVMAAFGIISGFLQEHGAKIQSDLTGAWTQIQAIIEGILPPIQSIVTSIFGAIQTFLEAHGAEIQAFLGQTWDQIAAIIGVALQLIQATIIPALTMIAGFIAAHSAEIQTLLTVAWTIISTVISTTLAVIQGVITVALQVVQGNWSGAWTTVQTTVSTVWTAIGTILTAALTGIQTEMQLIGSFISSVFGPSLTSIGTTVSSTVSPALATFNGVLGGVQAALGSVGGAVSGVITWVNSLASTLASIHIPDWLQGHSPPPLANWFSDIGAAAGGVAKTMPGVAQSIADVTPAANTLHESLSRFFNDFGDTGAVAGATFDALPPKVQTVIQQLNASGKQGVGVLENYFNGFDDALQQVPPAMQDTVARLRAEFEGIPTDASTSMTSLQTVFTKFLSDFGDWGQVFGPAFAALPVQVQEMVGKINDTLGSQGIGAMQNYFNGFDDYLQQLPESVRSFVSQLRSDMAQVPGDMKQSTDAITTALETQKQQVAQLGPQIGQLGDLQKHVDTTMQDTTKTMGDAVPDATTAGKNLVEGIIKGASGVHDSLVSYARRLVQDMIRAMKAAAGIASPSSLFADEVGAPIIQGIVGGIQSELPNLIQSLGPINTEVLDTLKGVAREANSAMAGIFSSQADLSKQQAANLEHLNQLADPSKVSGIQDQLEKVNQKIREAQISQQDTTSLFAQQKDLTTQLADAQTTLTAQTAAQTAAQAQLNAAMTDAKAKYQNPTDQAKYYQMESQYILQIADKQKQLASAKDDATKQRIADEIALLQDAQSKDEQAAAELAKNGSQQAAQLKAQIEDLGKQAAALEQQAAKEKDHPKKQQELADAAALYQSQADLQKLYNQLVGVTEGNPLGTATNTNPDDVTVNTTQGGAQTSTYHGTSGGAQTSGASTSTGTQHVTVNLGGVSVDQRGTIGSIDDRTLQKKLEAMFHDLMQKAVSSALKEAGASSDRRIRTRAT